MGKKNISKACHCVIGATFSHRHLKYLKLDVDEALIEFKKLNLKWMRVCCYWGEIEKEKGKFDFEEVDNIIKFCEKNKIDVILTVGMKAPRYPEYYLPDWQKRKSIFWSEISMKEKSLLNDAANFMEMTVKHFMTKKCIKIWQVENEPLDPSGEKRWWINERFLEKEIQVVRNVDSQRKILVNVWGNEMFGRKNYLRAMKLADIVGFDIYTRMPHDQWRIIKRYVGPFDSKQRIKDISDNIRKNGQDVVIAELQAEPWEKNELVAQQDLPPSFRPENFKKNIEYVASFEPSLILLWGFEYWLWRKENGQDAYWNEVKRIIKEK